MSQTVDAYGVTRLLQEAGLKSLRQTPFADRLYAVPTLDWVKRKYWPWFMKELRMIRQGKTGWTKKHDCDKYAKMYAALMVVCHELSTGPDAEGIAAWPFYYVDDRIGGHAINLVIAHDGRSTGVHFIDPQTNEPKQLSDTERGGFPNSYVPCVVF